MRLIYIHKSLRAAAPGKSTWDPERATTNRLLTQDFATDGYVPLFEAFISRKVLDEVVVVLESRTSPGHCQIGNLECYTMPNLEHLWPMVRKDDVFFLRGGYRWWQPFVDQLRKRKHWMIFNACGTGRSNWHHWDVLLWDFTELPFTKRGKLYLPFNKPIGDVFRYDPQDMEYDVCIGASNIYDVKSQWKVVEAAKAYAKEYGKPLKCILPGSVRRSTMTNQMLESIRSGEADVETPGEIPRIELAKVFNSSRIFAHHCSAQNDRAALEALACGTPMLSLSIGLNRYPRWVHNVQNVARAAFNPNVLAEDIHKLLMDPPDREHIADTYLSNNSREPTIKHFERLFKLLRAIDQGDRAGLVNEYLST